MTPYAALIERQREYFQTGITKTLSFRLAALRRLREAVETYERETLDALRGDLNKSEFEAYSAEIGIVLREIRFTMRRLRRWARPERVPAPLTHIGSRSRIYREPYGVALIISPWNFPFQLAFVPLVGAVAAGNCVVLKPSEHTPRTAEIIARIVREAFDEAHVAVALGDADASRALLAERTDYIFFTGSPSVGQAVMEAAAKRLTPVTLELGGKSPCIVAPDAKLPLAARRIAWGKFLNAGQTCVAPDYALVHRSVHDDFVGLLREAVTEQYGASPLAPGTGYTRIVNEAHFRRLRALLTEGEAAVGGGCDETRLLIDPTVLTGVSRDAAVMQDEIFGPILPVLPYDDLEDALEFVAARPKPLALYLFTENASVERRVLARLSFGGGCVNDTVLHFTNPHLPFGGVGPSGIGAYHGRYSFETFSHRKSVMKQTTRFDLAVRYPHVRSALSILRKVLR